MTIHPGDTVTLTVSWDSIVVPDEATALWLHRNPWAVRRHIPRACLGPAAPTAA